MTRYAGNNAIGDLGANFVERVCIHARVLYRRVVERDTGLDALIELTDHGDATGVIMGVQIKSGDSFVTDDGAVFTFKSSRDHFAYWARCAIPVIGIVYSPKHDRAIWVDLTLESTPERITSGPYVLHVEFSEHSGTSFSAETIQHEISSRAMAWVAPRRPLEEIRRLFVIPVKPDNTLVPAAGASTDRETAWVELIDAFCNATSPSSEQAYAGHRLSWYYPSVDEVKKKALTDRLKQMNDEWLKSVVRTVHQLLDGDQTTPAELIGDLLWTEPMVPARLESMLRQGRISGELREAAVQLLELNNGEILEDLRKAIGLTGSR